jgi:RNA polymerase sigma factor (sigma-70 family)
MNSRDEVAVPFGKEEMAQSALNYIQEGKRHEQEANCHKEKAEWHVQQQAKSYNAALEFMSMAFAEQLSRFCANLLGGNFPDRIDTANDITRQTLLIARDKMSAFRGRRGAQSLGSWLFTIARNICLKTLNEQKKQVNESLLNPRDTVVTETSFKRPQRIRWKDVWQSIPEDILQEAIKNLQNDKNRQIVRLHILKEMEITDIAEIFEMKDEAVRKRMWRSSQEIAMSLGMNYE